LCQVLLRYFFLKYWVEVVEVNRMAIQALCGPFDMVL